MLTHRDSKSRSRDRREVSRPVEMDQELVRDREFVLHPVSRPPDHLCAYVFEKSQLTSGEERVFIALRPSIIVSCRKRIEGL